MPISSNQIPPIPVPCRPACCKSPSLVRVTSSVNGQTNPASISVTFSNNVVGLNSHTFVVTGPNGPIVGGVGFAPATLQAIFTPSFPLVSGTYTATLSGLTDVKGCKIAPFTFTFGTCTTVTAFAPSVVVGGGNTLVTVNFTSPSLLVSYTVNGGAPLTGATPPIGSVSTSFVVNMGLTIGTNTLRINITGPAGGCPQLFQFSVTGGSIIPVPPS